MFVIKRVRVVVRHTRTPYRAALTERQAWEPVVEFFQYGSLRRVAGVAPFAASQQPRVSFGGGKRDARSI